MNSSGAIPGQKTHTNYQRNVRPCITFPSAKVNSHQRNQGEGGPRTTTNNRALNNRLQKRSNPGVPSFYQRSDKLVAGGVGLVSLVAYLATLAPAVTLEHSGALIVAGNHFGIGRVPGYVVWHLLANLFTQIFSAVNWCGHPNPARALNFMSALFGSFCCGLVSLLVHRMARSIVRGPASYSTVVPAVTAGWLFAFSPTMWSQSVIAETHSLTCFFVLLLIAMFVCWIDRPSRAMALGMGLVLGIALSQSHILVLIFPVFLLAMCLTDWRLCVGLVGSAGLFAVLAAAVAQTVPDGHWIVAGICALAVFILVPIRYGGCGARAVGMLLLFVCGLSLHAYLPIASSFNPPMDWGDPETWVGFKHVISRGQYEKLVLTDVWGNPELFVRQLGLYLRMLLEQYTGPIALLGLISAAAIRRSAGRMWAVCVLAFLMYSVGALIGVNPMFDIQTVFIVRRVFIPSFALYAVLIGCGLAIVVERLLGTDCGKEEEINRGVR